MASKRPWFGKRWTKSLIRWIDRSIFHEEDHPDFKLADSLFCINFTIGMILGIALIALSLFIDQDKLNYIVCSIALPILLLLSMGYYLYGNIKFYDTPLKKVGRVFFILILSFIAGAIGLFIGVWGAIIAVLLLVLWGVLDFSSSSSSSPRKSEPKNAIYSTDGDYLDASNATPGQSYQGEDGKWYRFNGGQFHRTD